MLPTTNGNGTQWGERGKERRELRLFAKALLRMNPRKQKLLLAMAQKMANQAPEE
jgi:hypothetical protein